MREFALCCQPFHVGTSNASTSFDNLSKSSDAWFLFWMEKKTILTHARATRTATSIVVEGKPNSLYRTNVLTDRRLTRGQDRDPAAEQCAKKRMDLARSR
jgi:hypothetical protein